MPYSEQKLDSIAKRVMVTARPPSDTPIVTAKKKFFKVYKAPGYPVDPKLEHERNVRFMEPMEYPETECMQNLVHRVRMLAWNRN